jgi:hypothetical protein
LAGGQCVLSRIAAFGPPDLPPQLVRRAFSFAGIRRQHGIDQDLRRAKNVAQMIGSGMWWLK